MESKIGIRFIGVTFPDGDSQANVAFELFASGYTVGEETRQVANFQQLVPRYKAGNNLPDYNAIVREAAKKLEGDFKRVVEMLADTYATPS